MEKSNYALSKTEFSYKIFLHDWDILRKTTKMDHEDCSTPEAAIRIRSLITLY